MASIHKKKERTPEEQRLHELARKYEIFRTPRDLTLDILLTAPKFFKQARILDPSAGDGRMTKAIERHGNKERHMLCEIRKSELKKWEKRFGDSHDYHIGNFLDLKPSKHDELCDGCLMNPPFSMGLEFVEHAKRWLHPGAPIYMIHRLEWLSTNKRSKLLSASTLETVYVVPYRVAFELDYVENHVASFKEHAVYKFRNGTPRTQRPDIRWLL